MQSTNQADAEIGQRLRGQREAAQLKACWVAGQLGITKQMLSMLENGQRRWSEARVEQYRKAIGDSA